MQRLCEWSRAEVLDCCPPALLTEAFFDQGEKLIKYTVILLVKNVQSEREKVITPVDKLTSKTYGEFLPMHN